MSSETESAHGSALDSVTKIVSVYLERSTGLSPGQVVSLVDGIFKVLLRDPAAGLSSAAAATGLEDGNTSTETAPASVTEPPKPAVPADQSVTPEHLVCLEDGHKVKLLKRYLRAKYDLTPRQYREKWGLPKDYPMVAPAYSAKRTAIAQASGLGARRPAVSPAAPVAPPTNPAESAPAAAAPKKKRPARPAASSAA